MDFAAVGVRPLHGHILHAQAEALGEEDDFYVEGKAVERLARKNGVHRAAAKCFKTTLRIAHTDACEEAEDGVKSLAHLAARQTLAAEDGAACVLAIADEHIHLRLRCEPREEAPDFLQRRGEIGIHEKGDVAARCEHPRAHGVAFPPLHIVGEDAEAGEPRRECARQLQGAIRAALDDEQYLVRPIHPREGAAQSRHARSEALGLVVGRDDE